VQRWDGAETFQQGGVAVAGTAFLRINGTSVGALARLVIYSVAQLIT